MESNFLYHSPCEDCGSSDANSVYDDGHTHCFSCGTTKRGQDLTTPETKPINKDFVTGQVTPLTKRGLDITTLQKFNYQTGTYNGKPVQIANYLSKRVWFIWSAFVERHRKNVDSLRRRN